MSSLARCLKKLGITGHEATILRGQLAEHGERATTEEALLELLRDLQEERHGIGQQIVEQGRAAPAPEAALQARLDAEFPPPATEVDAAAAQAEGHKASEDERTAGNYKKGHVQIGPEGATLEVSVENEAGTQRDLAWPPLKHHYGYIRNTIGYDKDHLDVFLIPGTPADYAGPVFVVNQTRDQAVDPDEERSVGPLQSAQERGFDEHKVIIGAPDADAALAAYRSNYEADWEFVDESEPVVEMTWPAFRAWARDTGRRGPKAGKLTQQEAQRREREIARKVPAPAGGENRVPSRPEDQRDLFATPTLPGTNGARSLETIVVEVEKQGSVAIPKGKISTAVEAAYAFKQLNTSPREKFLMIGTDENDKPVAFYELFKGTLTQTAVYPREVWTAAYGTKGVTQVWFAHNHPSGAVQPSHADEILTKNLREWLKPGQGVVYRDHIIIIGEKAYSIEGHYPFEIPDKVAEEQRVPVLERVVKKMGVPGPALTSPGAAREYMATLNPQEPGLLLLDAQHKVIGWYPFEVPFQSREFWTRAADDLIKMIGRNNPGAAMYYSPKAPDPNSGGVRQLREQLALADVKLLDWFYPNAGGRLISAAEQGLMEPQAEYVTPKKGAFSLRARAAADAERSVLDYEALERQVDAAYERGDMAEAERLDVELANLRERMIGMAEEAAEDEASADNELSLERGLAKYYTDWLAVGPGEDRVFIVEQARNLIERFAGGPTDASDQVVLDAMKDAYQAGVERRERVRGAYAIARVGPHGRGIHPNAVEWELRNNPLRLAMGSNLRIVRSPLNLPKHILLEVMQRGVMRDVKGYTDLNTGEVWLVAGNLHPGEAEVTLVHEAVGHVGVQNVLGPMGSRLFTDAMIDLYESNEAKIRAEVEKGFLKPYDYDLRNRNHRVQAAMEYIAHTAERGLEPTLWQKFVSIIRAILRRAGFVRSWSEADILRLLQISRSSLEWAGTDTSGGFPLWQIGKPGPVWYSALERAVERATTNRAPAAQWKATIKAMPGVKPAEIEWSGVNEWLDTQEGLVEKGAVLAYLRENGVKLTEVVLGGEATDPVRREWDKLVVELDSMGLIVETDAGDLIAVAEPSSNSLFVVPEHMDLFDLSPTDPPVARSLGGPGELTTIRKFDDLLVRDGADRQLRRLKELAPAFKRFHRERAFIRGPRHEVWTLRGGRDYLELAITLPTSSGVLTTDGNVASLHLFRDSRHFDDWNILAFVRTKARTDVDGKRVLFVEEIQSDWAEQGRKRGFTHLGEFAAFSKWMRENHDFTGDGVASSAGIPLSEYVGRWIRNEYDTKGSYWSEFKASPEGRAVRAAPFVGKTEQWVALALKRVIRYAADHGFERVAWTTGDQQNDRFNLAKRVSGLQYTSNGSLYIRHRRNDRWELEPYATKLDEPKLRKLVGDTLADRLLAAEKQQLPAGRQEEGEEDDRLYLQTIEGADLEFGGDAMREFYDKIVANIANDVLKRVGGGRVRTLDFTQNGLPQGWSVTRDAYDGKPAGWIGAGHWIVHNSDGNGVVRGATREAAIEAAWTTNDGQLSARYQPGFDITEKMVQDAPLGYPMFSLRERPGLSEVFGVRDGKMLGMARRAYGTGVWEIYLATGDHLVEGGQARRMQAATINEVNRIFNREGLELRVTRPANIPVPDGTMFDENWAAPKADTWRKRAVIFFQNRLLLPEQYERTIEGVLGKIPEEAKAHREARLAHPRAAGKIADFDHDFIEPIVELMKEQKLTVRDVGLYLYARHAPERNAAIEEINPDNVAGSGMTDERAAEVLVGFGDKLPALQQIGDLVNRVNRFREDVLIDKGLAKQEVVTLLREKYPNYVPLKEVVEDEYANSVIQNQTGAGYQVGRNIVRAFGRYSEADADLILPGLVAQAKGTIAAGENAEVLRAFLRQVQFAPNPDVWRIQNVIWKPYIDKDTGEVRYAPRPVQIDADYKGRAISVPVNGERHIVVVDDQRVATAFKSSGLAIPPALQVIGSITRFYATMATAANPEFVLVNLMRDFQQAMIRLTGEQNVELARKVAKDVPFALWGAFRGLRAQGQITEDAGEWHKWYRRYIEAGGHVAYRGIQDAEQQYGDFVSKLAEAGIYPEEIGLAGKGKLRIRRFAKVTRAKALVELVSDINGAVENALRLSAFKNAIEAGWNEKDAAMLSRNVTVDFNLKGEAGTFINSLYMFFNANIQGNALLIRSIVNHPRIQALVLALVLLGAAQDWWNREFAEKDAAGRSLYDDINEDIKQRNWVIMGPDRKNAILIPLPFGFNVFHTIGRHMVAVLPKQFGGADEKATKAAISVFGSLTNALSPFGNTPQSWLGMAQLISPTFADPVVQRITNRNWLDRPIFPERPRTASPQAAAETYYPGTPEHYVAAAQWMNRATGGNQVRSGFLDPYPNVLQHWTQQVFGSTGATYSRIVAAIGAKLAGKEVETRETPFLRRFYYEPRDFELSHRFYEYVNQSEVAHYEVLRAMQGGRAAEAAMLREEYQAERRMYGEAQDAERRVAAIRSEIAKVRAHPTMDKEVKKKTIDQMQEQSRGIMQRFNARFEGGQK